MENTTTAKLRKLVNEQLRVITNQVQIDGNRTSYHLEWSKGEGKITDNKGTVVSSYYVMRIWCIDKTNSPQGIKNVLYVNFYPTDKEKTLEQLEYFALKELLTNSMICLINVTSRAYEEVKDKEVVTAKDVEAISNIVTEDDLKKDIEQPKLII